MAKKIVCDRCLKAIMEPYPSNLWILGRYKSFPEQDWDICQECLDELKEWMKPKINVKE